MTHKIATKRVSDWLHIDTECRNLFLSELSFLALFLMPWQKAYSQELFFFLTWNEVNSTLARAKTGHETHEIKFFFSLDTYPQAKARKEKEEIDLIYLKDMNFIEKYSKYRSHFLKSPFPRSVSKQKRPHPNGKECFLCFTSCAKSRPLRMEHENSR